MRLLPARFLLAVLTVALLATSLAVAAPPAAPPAPAPKKARVTYRAAPEIFWISIYVSGKKAGFGRGQYGKGASAPFSYQNLIVMEQPQATRIAERTTWEFDQRLKPVQFSTTFIGWRPGAKAVTNTVEGKFRYDKGSLACDYHEWGAQEKVQVKIPPQQISRFTQNLILARASLKVGSRLKFRAYSVKDRRFVNQTISVTGYDGSRKAWKLEQTSEEAPGAVTVIWFQTASPQHPNGYAISTSMPGMNKQLIESRACSREEAIQGYEKEARALKI